MLRVHAHEARAFGQMLSQRAAKRRDLPLVKDLPAVRAFGADGRHETHEIHASHAKAVQIQRIPRIRVVRVQRDGMAGCACPRPLLTRRLIEPAPDHHALLLLHRMRMQRRKHACRVRRAEHRLPRPERAEEAQQPSILHGGAGQTVPCKCVQRRMLRLRGQHVHRFSFLHEVEMNQPLGLRNHIPGKIDDLHI